MISTNCPSTSSNTSSSSSSSSSSSTSSNTSSNVKKQRVFEEPLIKRIYPTFKVVHDYLFNMIEHDTHSEDIIVHSLNGVTNLDLLFKLINTPRSTKTMLMIAAYKLKSTVFVELLKLGANPHYKNTQNESVASCWYRSTCTKDDAIHILTIISASMLHGVNIHIHVNEICSILDYIKKNNVTHLCKNIINLGCRCRKLEEFV
jgi:hypothetical protein